MDRISLCAICGSIILAALIAGSMGRYEMDTEQQKAFRLDRLTGSIVSCVPTGSEAEDTGLPNC